MQDHVWNQEQIERALFVDYNEPLMRVDPREYSDRRDVPKYRVNEVSLYLGIKETTLRNWFFGYHRTIAGELTEYKRLIEPALHNPNGPSLSFYNLAEAHVLAATRQNWSVSAPSEPIAPAARPKFGERIRRNTDIKISMQAIRHALDYVSAESPVHPLISRYFFTDGKSLFIKVLEEQVGRLTVNISRGGQIAFADILDLYLERIERDESGPIKVFPLRHVDDPDKSIAIMPNVASGRPTINNTGIRVESIWNRSRAGETVEELADDYGIAPRVIEKAISYFTNVKAA